MTDRRDKWLGRALAALVAIAPLAPVASAQPSDASASQPVAPTSRPISPAGKAGLDTLSDDRLLAELASRGLDTLLDRAFDVNRVPAEKRQSIVILMQLQRLSDPKEKLSYAQRRQIVRSVASGIGPVLPSIKDPRLLMQYAATLIAYGVEPEVNTLEYWGESPKTQAELRPIVETVVRVLEKAQEEAAVAANDIANRIPNQASPLVKQWEQMDQLATSADYTRHMVLYDLALTIDRSDAKRNELANEAIEYLKQFDTPDSQVQPLVCNRLAKLHMVQDDYAKAKELFEPVALAKPEIKPAPDLSQQYEARYFTVLCDVLAGKTDPAGKGLQELIVWQRARLPKDNEQAIKGAEAAAAMLEYRLYSSQADRAPTQQAKLEMNQRARKVLLALVEQQPALGTIIYDQLLSRLPENPDFAALDDLELKAMLERGERERLREEGKPDAAVMERAIVAGRELLKRKDATKSLADMAAIVIPFLLEKLDRKAEAAGAFLDYLEKSPGKYRDLAFESAGALVFELRKESGDDAPTGELFDRFLPIAIDEPFNQRQYALVYARRLMLREQYKKAVEYFRLVPKDDRNALDGAFFQMLAIKGWLDTDNALTAAQRQENLRQIQALAATVRQGAERKVQSADSEETRSTYRTMRAKTTLLAADIAHKDQKDPRKALEILADFETAAKGLRDENELMAQALFLRVHCYMETDQAAQAADSLLPVLRGHDAATGAAMVYGVLKQLDSDLDKARGQNEQQDVRELTQARAVLTPFLVQWAETNQDPLVKAQTYRYKVFDADSRRRAAQLISDPSQRRQKLLEVLEVYKALQSPENMKLFQATLTDKKHFNEPDPTVQLGVALIQYDLENWAEARPILRELIEKGRLGTGAMEVNDPITNQVKVVDNDIYWEARYKLIDANWRIAAASNDAKLKEEIASDLRLLFVKWQDKLGGQRYREAFESLRQQIVPDFVPEKRI